jgi:hypothetical protein
MEEVVLIVKENVIILVPKPEAPRTKDILRRVQLDPKLVELNRSAVGKAERPFDS